MAEMTANSPRVIQNYSNAERLVIVPGHAIYVGSEASQFSVDKYWVGGFANEAKYYAEHAFAGIEYASNPKTLLVFSGGQTRTEVAGVLTEAQSYYLGSDQNNFLNKAGVKERSRVEVFARDSFENLAFGVGVFAMTTGRMPTEIAVCGWGFKAGRYMMHAEALGIANIVQYISVNNLAGSEADASTLLGGAIKGEAKTRDDFSKSPLGNKGILQEKKDKRDLHIRGDAAYRYYNVSELFPILRQQ